MDTSSNFAGGLASREAQCEWHRKELALLLGGGSCMKDAVYVLASSVEVGC